MRILALALGVPFPPAGGGLARSFHLLRALASRHNVVLAAFTYGEAHTAPPFPIRLETVPWQWSQAYQEMTGADPDAAQRAYRRLTFDDDEPWMASVVDPRGMAAAIERALDPQPDLILIQGTPLARFMPGLPAATPKILDLFDVHCRIAARALADAPAGERDARAREAERTLAFEQRAAHSCEACVVVSEEEAVEARTRLGARRVDVVPNGVDTSYFSPAAESPERGALLFTGRMSYPPNADAACYFATDILPLVRRQVPDARFHIVGTGPPPQLTALASDAVVVHGFVDDVRPFQARAEVVVVPVRAGGGTRLKVLEAAASGKAIVTTALGVEGLSFRAGRDVVVADSTEEFAAAVTTLLLDPVRRAELGANARAVAGRYEWSAIGDAFRRTVEDVAAR